MVIKQQYGTANMTVCRNCTHLDLNTLRLAPIVRDRRRTMQDRTGSQSMETRIGRGETTSIIIITAAVRIMEILGIESHIEGTGPSEPETASRHVRKAVMNGVNVGRFYGDGTFDANDLFSLLHVTATNPHHKDQENHIHGSVPGIETQEKGYHGISRERVQNLGRGEQLWDEMARNRGHILRRQEEVRGEPR